MKKECVKFVKDEVLNGVRIPKGTELEVLDGGYGMYNGEEVDLNKRYRMDFAHTLFLK